MPVQDVLEYLRFDTGFMRGVTAWERIPARPARYADYPEALNPRLVDLLREMSHSPLYTHQAKTIEAVLNGENVALVTGTASGKSLAYHLPTLQFLLENPRATALYLFPTKALAQDQAAALGELAYRLNPDDLVPVNVYDGDTPQGKRARIRKEGGVVLSNPDMLHVGILPYHTRWVQFFQNLRLVVLDELHIYRGIFGSHMANVLRRLRRVCRFYGSEPIFVCTSATIANPGELAERLLNAPVSLIEEDGSPQGEKHIILYNPPVIDPKMGLRRSYTLETRSIAGKFLNQAVQTIIFARARLTTELLLGYVRDEGASYGVSTDLIRGYRGGYLPNERREIEKGLRDGAVRGVVATNALELGVDIGALGAAILAGYPGTLASTWQQFGRAGRRADVSVGILISSGAPLDQYIASHPAFLFERPAEHALIDPDNLIILMDHIRCAVYELPFEQGEGYGPFEDVHEVLSLLSESGEVHEGGGLYRWVSNDYPPGDVNLRASGSDTVVIQKHADGEAAVIGEVDRPGAMISVYEGAIYTHEGRQHLIENLDWENGVATAVETEADYYTRASTATDVDVEEQDESEVVGDCVKSRGRLRVTGRATGYRIIKRYTHETLGFGPIDLPPQTFETTGYWVSLTPDLTAQLIEENLILLPNDYGPNWAAQRDKARERDAYRCRRCNAPEKPGQSHDVHHVQPFREFAYIPGLNETYKEANGLANLLTLCKSCHRAVEIAQGTRSALAGAAALIKNVATLYLMCSPNDIGIVTEQKSAFTQAPTITVYDHAPGGMGLSVRLFDLHIDLLRGALEMVRDCDCEEGCPACVGPAGDAGSGAKDLSIRLLEAMVRSEESDSTIADVF